MSEESTTEAFDSTIAGNREGLPPGYRMRADRHYVDQLATSSAGHPVRMVQTAQIESDGPLAALDLRPLIESIRVHGIVQPLLIRRQYPNYAIVGGRKRLAAARTLRLETVPCIVHELNDADAVAMAAADNLSLGAPRAQEPAALDALRTHKLLAEHVTTIHACADLLPARLSSLDRSALDLVKAHSWRAARLIDALDLIAGGPVAAQRDRGLSSIVDGVVEGFGPEARLTGVTLRADISDDRLATGTGIAAGLCGAILATFPLVERATRPTVTIRASVGAHDALVLEVSQKDAPVAAHLAERFFDDDTRLDRPGGYAAAIGALAFKALASRCGVQATFEVIENGSRLAVSLPR